MLEDTLLKLRFNRGNRDALRRIYEKYKDDLLKLAVALLNDISLAEDVVNDSFVSFAQSIGEIRLRGNLKSFLNLLRKWQSLLDSEETGYTGFMILFWFLLT